MLCYTAWHLCRYPILLTHLISLLQYLISFTSVPLYPILLHSTSLCVIVTSHHFSLPFLFMPSAMSSLDDLSVSVPASVTSLPYFFDPTNLSPLPLPSPLCSGGSYGDGRRDPYGPQRRSVSLPPPPFLPTFHFVLSPSSPHPFPFVLLPLSTIALSSQFVAVRCSLIA